MIPDGSLSTTNVESAISGARGRHDINASGLIDYEDGGVGIGDASEGLLYQEWTGSCDGTDIKLIDEALNETVIYSGTNITEMSFTFDQNMNYAVVFVEDGTPKFKWYDATAEDYTVTPYVGITHPKVMLDDKRDFNTSNSDIILTYIKDSVGVSYLYYRQQRDRYTVEYLLETFTTEGLVAIDNFGMGANMRLHWVLKW